MRAPDILYMDNAATSFPKPPSVVQAISDFTRRCGANPGRSAHRLSIEAARIVFDVRERLTRLFDAPSSDAVILTKNCTEATNLVLRGLLKPGDRVVVSDMEHNAIMRPLTWLRERSAVGIETFATYDDPRETCRSLEKTLEGGAKLVAFLHGSNVTGAVLPIRELVRIAHERGANVLIDCAQTAGCKQISFREIDADYVAFSGHKGLMGPQGTGALLLKPEKAEELEPLILGGTGSRSESLAQPDFLPDRFESGTLNTHGLAGLAAALRFVEETSVATIEDKLSSATRRLVEGLTSVDGIHIHHGQTPSTCAVVSVVFEKCDPAVASLLLDREYGVLTRPGLHCAPAAHRKIGTFPYGTVRFAPGFFTAREEIDKTIEAVAAVAKRFSVAPHGQQRRKMTTRLRYEEPETWK